MPDCERDAGNHTWPEAEFVQQPAAQKACFYRCALIDKLETTTSARRRFLTLDELLWACYEFYGVPGIE